MTKHSFVAAVAALALMSMSGQALAVEGLMPASGCPDCDAPKKYDSQEVVKTSSDVDQSRAINTASYDADPRAKVRVRSDVTLVNFVVHRYRMIEAPALVPA